MDADTSVSSRNNSCSESAEYVTIIRRTIDEATALEQEGYWDKVLIFITIFWWFMISFGCRRGCLMFGKIPVTETSFWIPWF